MQLQGADDVAVGVVVEVRVGVREDPARAAVAPPLNCAMLTTFFVKMRQLVASDDDHSTLSQPALPLSPALSAQGNVYDVPICAKRFPRLLKRLKRDLLRGKVRRVVDDDAVCHGVVTRHHDVVSLELVRGRRDCHRGRTPEASHEQREKAPRIVGGVGGMGARRSEALPVVAQQVRRVDEHNQDRPRVADGLQELLRRARRLLDCASALQAGAELVFYPALVRREVGNVEGVCSKLGVAPDHLRRVPQPQAVLHVLDLHEVVQEDEQVDGPDAAVAAARVRVELAHRLRVVPTLVRQVVRLQHAHQDHRHAGQPAVVLVRLTQRRHLKPPRHDRRDGRGCACSLVLRLLLGQQWVGLHGARTPSIKSPQ
eukprot:Rhum_TRINITY_DN11786_c0_g2::Rhum_TRINITY_DN11786_c0_g2_i2::g.46899::m.46899